VLGSLDIADPLGYFGLPDKLVDNQATHDASAGLVRNSVDLGPTEARQPLGERGGGKDKLPIGINLDNRGLNVAEPAESLEADSPAVAEQH